MEAHDSDTRPLILFWNLSGKGSFNLTGKVDEVLL
jgi:hypothetical protein